MEVRLDLFQAVSVGGKNGGKPNNLVWQLEAGAARPRRPTMQLLKQTAFEEVPSAACRSNTFAGTLRVHALWVLAFRNDFTAPCTCIMTSRTVRCPRPPLVLRVVAREQAEGF